MTHSLVDLAKSGRGCDLPQVEYVRQFGIKADSRQCLSETGSWEIPEDDHAGLIEEYHQVLRGGMAEFFKSKVEHYKKTYKHVPDSPYTMRDKIYKIVKSAK